MNFLFFDISCISSEFPEEDSAEDELKAAELHNEEVSDHLSPPIDQFESSKHTKVQARLAHERHVFSILDRAAGCANQALASLQNVCTVRLSFGVLNNIS